jgi:uncharacterized repeat protein (TIGR01451 family)
LNDSTQINSGTYRPTDFETAENLTSPAPAGPYGTALAAFNGSNPNGTWSLYIRDDSSQDTGSLTSWSLTINGSNAVCCTGPGISDLSITGAATPDPAVVGGNFTVSLVVSNTGPDAAGAVTLTNPLPPGVTFVSAASSQGTITNNTGIIAVALGTLSPGGAATISLTLAATNIGTVTNVSVAGSTGLDPMPANNSSSIVVTVPADFDADGLPDLWELANGLSPTNAADAAIDLDGDNFTAAQEYLAGTGPADARNFLGIVSVNLVGADGVIEFSSVTGRVYDVELTDGWPPVLWTAVATNVPGTGANVLVTNLGVGTTTNRVYRVRLRP